MQSPSGRKVRIQATPNRRKYLHLQSHNLTKNQMIEIIGLLIISWICLWFYERGNLSVLGLNPTRANAMYSIILFIVSAFCCFSGYLMHIYFAQEEYSLNPLLHFNTAILGFWQTFKSVLFEELLCRGVLL